MARWRHFANPLSGKPIVWETWDTHQIAHLPGDAPGSALCGLHPRLLGSIPVLLRADVAVTGWDQAKLAQAGYQLCPGCLVVLLERMR